MTHVCGCGNVARCLPRSNLVTLQQWSLKPAGILAESRDDGKHKQRRGANVRQINRPALWEKESERTGGGRVWVRRKKRTELVMWARGGYMSADIQERWMPHKAPLLEGRTRGRSSCLPGRAAIRLPPSCQSLEKWPIHIQDIGSVFKDWWDIETRTTYTGRSVFLTTCNTHRRTFSRKCMDTLRKHAAQ